MTKYILHGGDAQIFNNENDLFFREILKDCPNNPKILLVYFAKEVDRIPKNKAEDVEHFEKNKESKQLSFEIASEEYFLNQINNSDIVYIHGGSTVKLMSVLSKFENLQNHFKGKIVAGESAGANALSTICYSPSVDLVVKGLGILPVKIIPHYLPGKEIKLEGARQELELLLLSVYKYKVFKL